MDWYTISFILAAILFYYYFHAQNLIEDARKEGVNIGYISGYNDGRSEIDEDMYEQGREQGYSEATSAISDCIPRKCD